MRKRIEDYDKILPVLELYRAVQSEGSRFGRPTVVIRTTGCTHRCYFGEGGWCDSWYTSIHPEKGMFTFNDIVKFYDQNPHNSTSALIFNHLAAGFFRFRPKLAGFPQSELKLS